MIDSTTETRIRSATTADAEAMAGIYTYYVANSVITFHEEPIPPSDFARRILATEAASYPWLVAESGDRVVGYAFAGMWKDRSAYRFSAEVTIYVDHEYGGKGVGSHLYDRLFPILRDMGAHAIMAGIALPNDASVALHEKFGMVKVAHFKEVGFKCDRWVDVGYWELLTGDDDH